ncbi:MAG TPA: hypothetical protein ENK29_01305 [Chromatiales bacterium]|nr:hypothetical protein [Chromatiales bacterium]
MATAQPPSLTRQQAQSLRQLIGRQARYHGTRYEIIEVLEDESMLVLEDCEDHKTIQADQHGEAHRRVPQTLSLHIPFLPDGEPDLEAVGLDLMGLAPGNTHGAPLEDARD